ncbi:F0F1 ATP synthase subunit gamma [Arsenicicoccus piscis]|uniref:ATP synthase gamma chain n=1 Tax=Arsenicicoccus piscis TaxID=673954 RepID=A0ABQ6HQK2_9MICO|nr:F0F1 ATP synthase subunit gamma [Arsenicicoccus piscis]MCH8629154.1 F0F1 ATP synthase subunit gamma [Arsenicicoccus piscis]GMA20282.1 ATP synthase gamma chain [Arsenicicoccus piscis]
MGGQMRVYRQRIRSVTATKKITKAMELIAASRVVKARERVLASAPYTHALTHAVSAAATYSSEEHPLTRSADAGTRAGVVIVTSDRGLAGAYSASALKAANELMERLRGEGKEVVPYLVGRKAISWFKFRDRDFAASWEGFSDSPKPENAREIADRVIADFLTPDEEGGLSQVHVVYTRFRSMVTQEARDLRLLPLEVVEKGARVEVDEGFVEQRDEGELQPLYSFEPDADTVLDQLLPQYVASRIYTCLLGAAASELAARQRAMKSATDNAEELIKTYTRLANQARQAEITQEISEIVGGANALADAK